MSYGILIDERPAPQEEYDYSDVQLFDEGLRSESKSEYGQGGATIENARLIALSGRQVNLLNIGERYLYTYSVTFAHSAKDVAFGMAVRTINGVELTVASTLTANDLRFFPQGSTARLAWEFTCNLAPGTYFTNAGVSAVKDNQGRVYLHRILDAVAFKVLQPTAPSCEGGLVNLDVNYCYYDDLHNP